MRPPDDAAELDRLNRHWDDLIRDGADRLPAAPDTGLDPTIASEVARLHGLDDPTAPDPAFRRRLRSDLFGRTGVMGPLSMNPVAAPPTRLNGRTPHPLAPRPAVRPTRPRRWWPPLELAAAVLLIVALGAVALSLGPGWDGRDRGETGDWATFRGGAARTGASPGEGPESEPGVLWRFAPDTPTQPAVTVAGGIAYVSGDEAHLYALDAETGEQRWRFSPGTALNGAPAVTDGLVLVGGEDGVLYAVDLKTGRERWRIVTGGPLCCSPAVVGEMVYVGSADGTFYALAVKDGSMRWRFVVADVSWSSPAVADGTVYVGTDQHSLYALDAATGTERWRFETQGSGVVPVVAVADGTVFATSWDGALYAIDAATGQQRWRYVGFATVFPPAVAGGLVYAGSADGNLYALDAATGDERWRFETGERIAAPPAVVDGVVYVGSEDGYLYALDAAIGTLRWRVAAAPVGYGPVVADGRLYLWGLDGHVWALGGDGESTGTPVPAATPQGGCACEAPSLGLR